MKELTLLNFSEVYPDEGTCVEALRRFHEEHGLSCSIGTRRTSLGYAAAAVMRPRSVPAR